MGGDRWEETVSQLIYTHKSKVVSVKLKNDFSPMWQKMLVGIHFGEFLKLWYLAGSLCIGRALCHNDTVEPV